MAVVFFFFLYIYNPGDVTLLSLVPSDSLSNFSEILCMSYLSASFMKSQQKIKELHCSQAFSYSKSMGSINCHSNQSSEAIFLECIIMQAILYKRHATDKIQLRSASRLQRYCILKVCMTDDDGGCHPIS